MFSLQLKHYLKHNFGIPYDEQYYNGDWMMGPNLFCWQPFCDIHRQLYIYSNWAMPSSYEELEDVIDRIMKHKVTIDRYRYDDHVIVALLHSVAISNKRIVELHTY